MSRVHYAQIMGLFVAACICVTFMVALNSPVTASSEKIEEEMSAEDTFFEPPKRAPFSILAQTTPLTETGTTTLPPVEIISSTKTLLDLVITEAAAEEEKKALESEQVETEQVETEQAETEPGETELIEPEQSEPEQVESELIETESAESVEAESVEAELIEPRLVDTVYSEAIDGTVFANRTSAKVTIFIEGELYRLAPLRSLGITLQRSPTAINMFSCDADTPESTSSCYWDVYRVNTDGFYEVFNKSPEGAPLQLVLQEAGPPPADRIWIQNRSGQREILVVENELYELQPATVQEFDAKENSEVDFYHRSCIQIADESACEWIPTNIKTGFYYALSETSAVGGIAGSQINRAEIRPLLAQDGNRVEQPLQVVCQVQVPKLNVRSGPGLNYLIVTSILQESSATGGRIAAIGRDASEQWIAVDQSIALGGWINSSSQLVVCDGDIATLPITEATDGRLAPTAVPAPTRAPLPATAVSVPTSAPIQSPPTPLPRPPAQPQPAQPQPTPPPPPTAVVPAAPVEQAETDSGGEENSSVSEEVPPGQLRLVVQNVFEHEIRFTLSPEEYDLQPGQTITIIRAPGRFTFSVSSPWRGLSGNSELTLEGDQSYSMFLYFVPKPGKSDEWEMKYQ